MFKKGYKTIDNPIEEKQETKFIKKGFKPKKKSKPVPPFAKK